VGDDERQDGRDKVGEGGKVMVMAMRVAANKEGQGNEEDDGVNDKGGVQWRGQWWRLQEQWGQGWRASNGDKGNGDGKGEQQLTSNGSNKGGWWMAREHWQDDHTTTMVGDDEQQEHVVDDDGSNKEGKGGKSYGDGNEDGGQGRGQGWQRGGLHCDKGGVQWRGQQQQLQEQWQWGLWASERNQPMQRGGGKCCCKSGEYCTGKMPWLKAFHVDTYIEFLQLSGSKTAIFLAPCICKVLFVAQIKVPRGGIICATN
jgi:hypothetical protein